MSKYKEQLERVERYYDRFKRINDGTDQRSPSTDDFVDDVRAFFINCYHMRDWLIKDDEYTAHSRRQIEAYITNTEALALCADICNGIKHLERNPDSRIRSGVQPEFGNTEFKIEVDQTLFGDDPPPITSIHFTIKHGDEELDAFELAGMAIQAWKDFIVDA